MYNSFGNNKTSSHVQIFIGLCMAFCFLFLCKDNICKAYDFGPSGIPASPTPIPTFITYGFDVLDPDGTQSNWLNHDMLHIETNRTSETFYQTIYKSNLINSISAYLDIYNRTDLNISSYEPYINEFMQAFDTYFPFDVHDPKYLINSFISGDGVYFTVDLNYNSFDIDPTKYLIGDNGNNKLYAYSDKFISTFVNFPYTAAGYMGYGSFNPSTSKFGIQNKDFSHFYSYTGSSFSYFSDLGFQTPLNPSTYQSIFYYFTVGETNNHYREGNEFIFDTNLFCPLIIFKPILIFDEFSFGTEPINHVVNGNDYSGNYWSIYLFPNLNTYEDFEWFYTLYEPIDWFNKYYRGLTYTTAFEPVPVTPIPTFSIPFTPTPFPTNIFNPVVTPINLPLNPIIQISEYGKPWDFVAGIIPLLHSALNSGTVHLFIQSIEYIYNSSLFFEVIMFLIPSICLLAFILGRLKRK